MPKYQLDRSLARETWKQLDAFTQGYVEAAMWTLTWDDGESLDYLGLHDIAAATLDTAKADCEAFQTHYSDLLHACSDDMGFAQHGHDFWLTRNRHGAGY